MFIQPKKNKLHIKLISSTRCECLPIPYFPSYYISVSNILSTTILQKIHNSNNCLHYVGNKNSTTQSPPHTHNTTTWIVFPNNISPLKTFYSRQTHKQYTQSNASLPPSNRINEYDGKTSEMRVVGIFVLML